MIWMADAIGECTVESEKVSPRDSAKWTDALLQKVDRPPMSITCWTHLSEGMPECVGRPPSQFECWGQKMGCRKVFHAVRTNGASSS